MPKKIIKHVWVSAEKAENGRYSFIVTGRDYDAESLGRLFDLLEDSGDEQTFMTFPVIRELENPELLRVLDQRIAEIESGKTKSIPWKEVRKKLDQIARKPKKP